MFLTLATSRLGFRIHSNWSIFILVNTALRASVLGGGGAEEPPFFITLTGGSAEGLNNSIKKVPLTDRQSTRELHI
jgi:hypothetical protein